MNGDSADPILADFYAFGARGFNAAAALSDMIRGADGDTRTGPGSWYTERPNAAEYIRRRLRAEHHGRLRKPCSKRRLGDPRVRHRRLRDLAAGAAAWRATDAAVFARPRHRTGQPLRPRASGYIEPRDAAGAFPSGPPVQIEPGKGQNGFEEGNAAQYTWMVPQDLAGLIPAMGGDKAADSRLRMRSSPGSTPAPTCPTRWQGNELGLGTPWIYDSAAEPWKTQALVKRITSQLYSLTPGGEPGNDDLGALSSWYVWATLGLYPQTPGVPMLVLGTPQFPVEVIHGAYSSLTIVASGAGDPYVRGLAVNGRPSQRTYVAVNGTRELDFTLSKTPDTSWGSAAGDAPPSFGLRLSWQRSSHAGRWVHVCQCLMRRRRRYSFPSWSGEAGVAAEQNSRGINQENCQVH